MVKAEITKEVMNLARKRAKMAGATVNDILLAAFYRAYAALPGIDDSGPMSVMSMMDLRRHCKTESRRGFAICQALFQLS